MKPGLDGSDSMALFKRTQCMDCGSPTLDLAAEGSRTGGEEGRSRLKMPLVGEQEAQCNAPSM